MNTNLQLTNPSRIKETLCQHFKLPLQGSRLTIQKQNYIGLGEGISHYYIFTLMDDRVMHRAFGKSTPKNKEENEALQYLMKSIPDGRKDIGRPIALLKEGNSSLLLLEYLEGCSNVLTLAHFLRALPNTAANMANIGKAILDKIYSLQMRCPTVYRPLSSEDTEKTPGQPEPIGILDQLKSVKSLSATTKAAVKSRMNAIMNNQSFARKGLVHGQMGMRNIMVDTHSNIFFIDWEYLESEGLCAFDPCYMVVMLLMRNVQLFVSQSTLDMIADSLFSHTRSLEKDCVELRYREGVADSLWFAKCLAMIDTLWSYETSGKGWLKASLGRERQKIKYLANLIEKAAND